ncbi:MAG TPA: hypothetical protein VF062_25615 [Candidatus Limnocylindrales bacterium]
MTTRRGVLGAMGFAALTGLMGACSPGTRQNETDLLLIAHAAGLGVFDTGKRDWAVAPLPAVATDRELATLDGQQLVLRHRKTLEVRAQSQLKGDWTISAVGGDQIALIGGLKPARKRTGTTLLIMRGDIERYRYELPGSIEPEAFSDDGQRLFVLEHLADTYRVRSVELATGTLEPLVTRDKKFIPDFAEEIMRGDGHHSVYDSTRGMLFTLFTHGGDHKHAGVLLGVRPDAPGIHAFIHALSLREGWAVCVDLPAPFGDAPAANHTITRTYDRVFAIAGEGGVVAEVDPHELKVSNTTKVAPSRGDAHAIYTDQLIVATGNRLAGRDVGFAVRGLANGHRLWAGKENAVVAIENGEAGEEIQVPGLVRLR